MLRVLSVCGPLKSSSDRVRAIEALERWSSDQLRRRRAVEWTSTFELLCCWAIMSSAASAAAKYELTRCFDVVFLVVFSRECNRGASGEGLPMMSEPVGSFAIIRCTSECDMEEGPCPDF